jgi:putative endonuclease
VEAIDLNRPFCPSERSRRISNYFSVKRDYNFWVYIMTNDNDSVLYTGMTNDLVDRVGEHGSAEIPGFTAQYSCHKLVYYEHCTNVLGRNYAREANQKLVTRQKSEAHRHIESALD